MKSSSAILFSFTLALLAAAAPLNGYEIDDELPKDLIRYESNLANADDAQQEGPVPLSKSETRFNTFGTEKRSQNFSSSRLSKRDKDEDKDKAEDKDKDEDKVKDKAKVKVKDEDEDKDEDKVKDEDEDKDEDKVKDEDEDKVKVKVKDEDKDEDKVKDKNKDKDDDDDDDDDDKDDKGAKIDNKGGDGRNKTNISSDDILKAPPRKACLTDGFFAPFNGLLPMINKSRKIKFSARACGNRNKTCRIEKNQLMRRDGTKGLIVGSDQTDTCPRLNTHRCNRNRDCSARIKTHISAQLRRNFGDKGWSPPTGPSSTNTYPAPLYQVHRQVRSKTSGMCTERSNCFACGCKAWVDKFPCASASHESYVNGCGAVSIQTVKLSTYCSKHIGHYSKNVQRDVKNQLKRSLH